MEKENKMDFRAETVAEHNRSKYVFKERSLCSYARTEFGGQGKMKCYKGFDKGLKCRDFQYEIGKEYEEERAEICDTGFHACENPLDVFGYYAPADSRYCEVELDANNQKLDDSKRVGKKISIKAEIGIAGIIKTGQRQPTPETGQRQPTPETGQRQQ